MSDYIKNKKNKFKMPVQEREHPPVRNRITDDSRVCVHPFTNLMMYNTPGPKTFMPHICCLDWLDKDNKVNDGSENVSQTQESFNSETIKNIRRGILDGTYSGCSKTSCPMLATEAETGKPSFQHLRDAVSDPHLRQKIKNGDVDGYYPLKYQDTTIRDCNLYCRSCRGGIVKDSDDMIGKSKELFNHYSKVVEDLHFLGSGEFMVVPHLKKFLMSFTKSEYPNIRRFFILSNGTLLSKKALDSFTEDFWNTDKYISISIDAATKEVYSKVRLGGNFDTVEKNLKYLMEKAARYPNNELQLSFVIQEENFHDMVNLMEMANSLNIRKVFLTKIQPWEGAGDYGRVSDVSNPNHKLHEDYNIILKNAKQLAKEFGIELLGNG